MVQIIFLLFALLNPIPAFAENKQRAEKYSVQDTVEDSLFVTNALAEARKSGCSMDNANIFFSSFFIKRADGKPTPYIPFTLEDNPKEMLVVNTRQVDCSTFVEQVLALSLCVRQQCFTYAAFKENLRTIRYENGEVVYGRRNHYFTGWAENNRTNGIISFVETPANIFSSTQTVQLNWMTTHINNYKMLKNDPLQLPLIKNMEKYFSGKSYKYIPKSKAALNTKEMRETVHDGDIIVLLTTKAGLDTHHLGFAKWHKEGLHLINASSLKKNRKVVEENITLYHYMQKQPTMQGFRVVRLNP